MFNTFQSKLNLSGNQLGNLPDLHLDWQKSLCLLDLSRNNFVAIPPTVCRLSALVELHISNNHIAGLPEKKTWVTPKLKVLDLSNNRLVYADPSRNSSPHKDDK